MKKYGFTMLELVVVIVVIGIIAAFSMPDTKGTDLANGSKQVIGHVRYTQHLAMISNKYAGDDATWFYQNWQIEFFQAGTKNTYAIYNDLNKNGTVELNEAVQDAATNTVLAYKDASTPFSSSSRIIDLNKEYDIVDVNIAYTNTNCTGKRSIVFDYYGRPYCDAKDMSSMTGATITLKDSSGDQISLVIENESGYVHYN